MLPALVMVTPAERVPAPTGKRRAEKPLVAPNLQSLRPRPPQVRDRRRPSARQPPSEPCAPFPPVQPRRRPLPCPRHLPRPLRRAGPERPERVRERPLSPATAGSVRFRLRVQSPAELLCSLVLGEHARGQSSLAAPGGEKTGGQKTWAPSKTDLIRSPPSPWISSRNWVSFKIALCPLTIPKPS